MRKQFTAAAICFYLVVLLYLTLVYHTTRRVSPSAAVNLVPFRTIAHYVREGGWEMIVNLPGNLLAFVPLGLLLPVLRAPRGSLREVALEGAGLSTVIEVAQYLSGRRVADVDDVFLNTLGTVIGYLIFVTCKYGIQLFAVKVDHASS